MATYFTPERRTLGDVLSSKKPLVVPEWQRSYSWRRTEVEAFWTDLNKFSELYPADTIRGHEYFLGSIVLVDLPARREILDGQQRLATAAILLSAIRDAIARYKKDAAIRLQQTYLVAYDDATEQSEHKLTLNIYDRGFFPSVDLGRSR